MHKNRKKYCHTKIIIIKKSIKASVWESMFDEYLLVNEKQTGGCKSHIVNPTHVGVDADQH